MVPGTVAQIIEFRLVSWPSASSKKKDANLLQPILFLSGEES